MLWDVDESESTVGDGVPDDVMKFDLSLMFVGFGGFGGGFMFWEPSIYIN